MKRPIIAAAVLMLMSACGEAPTANQAVATNAAAADHDEAEPTPAATENHGHEHEGNQSDHAH